MSSCLAVFADLSGPKVIDRNPGECLPYGRKCYGQDMYHCGKFRESRIGQALRQGNRRMVRPFYPRRSGGLPP